MKFTKTIKLALSAVTLVVASLLVGYVIGVVDSETAQNSGEKAVIVIGIVTLAFIALGAIAGSSNSDK